MRIEKDFIGQMELEGNTLYGIHTARARDNFALGYKGTNPALIHASGGPHL